MSCRCRCLGPKKLARLRPKLLESVAIGAVAIAAAGCQNAAIPRRSWQQPSTATAAPVTGRAVARGAGSPCPGQPFLQSRGAPEQRSVWRKREPRRLAVDHDEAPRQELLPPLRWLLQPMTTASLTRPEIEVARLLTFYGLRWAYEPTTFAVRWGEGRTTIEFVTPDFYLPEHDLYLELTTMRQRLVTRKNRKFRLLRETYPNVRVRLLYLRDFQRLRDVYGPSRAEREARISGVLYDERDVEMRIAQLAQQLIEAWDSRRQVNPVNGRCSSVSVLGQTDFWRRWARICVVWAFRSISIASH